MPFHIARLFRLLPELERSWQPLQSRVSLGPQPEQRFLVAAAAAVDGDRQRRAAGVLGALGRWRGTSHLLVAYSCIQIGAPRALMTSSTVSDVWSDRICR